LRIARTQFFDSKSPIGNLDFILESQRSKLCLLSLTYALALFSGTDTYMICEKGVPLQSLLTEAYGIVIVYRKRLVSTNRAGPKGSDP
jgi:hypothetical protein